MLINTSGLLIIMNYLKKWFNMDTVYFAVHKNGCGFGKTVQAAKAGLVKELGEDLDYEEITFYEAKKINVKVQISINVQEDEKDIVSSH